MSKLFQHLLFISFNLHHTKAHVQHHKYIITSMIFTIYYHFLEGTKKLMSRYAVHEDRPV